MIILNILIRFYKVPELVLTLFSKELAGKYKAFSLLLVNFSCILNMMTVLQLTWPLAGAVWTAI